MEAPTTITLPRGRPLWLKILASLAVFVALVALVIAFFPWDILREPLNRYVSGKTGRQFEITRHLDVKLGRTTRVIADGLEFANPSWAQDPYLVKAEGGEIHVELWPLLQRRIELPLVVLRKPQLGLQVEKDGRRTWALGRDAADPANLPTIGALVIDQGTAHFVATHQGADIKSDFAIDGAGEGDQAQMPLSFKASGTWQKERFTATGRTGSVLYLSEATRRPFPMRVQAVAGATTVKAGGTVTNLATLEGVDAKVDIQGANLGDLYKLLGVVLPATPRYALNGQVTKQGEVWSVRSLQGKLGNTDLAGEMSFDRSQSLPMLTGKITSKSLDFDDLAPLVGLPEQPRSAAALPQVVVAGSVAVPIKKPARVARVAAGKVLPTAQLDTARLRAMNADVTYSAARITHARQLPLESMGVQVKLKEGVMLLDVLRLGVASGTVRGTIRIDGNSTPAIAQANLDARALELGKLFPGLKITKGSFGKIHGDIDLKGRGASVAQMLGTSSGNVVMLMGRGEISNLLLEIAGLDGAEILKFLWGGDKNVVLRCGAVGFDVKSGLMASRALVLDTEDTIIYGDGNVSLANETLDFTLHPYPKDMSILSLRSPLKVSGTFVAPRTSVDKGALAGRAGVALALGAVNPLLALAATVETGPGKDANCDAILREAASPYSAAKVAALAKAQAQGATATGASAQKPSFFERLFGRAPEPAVAPSPPAAVR
ncbi:AsmA family protein [Caenimonas sp. SL110]|uniref:AsmA family protein n=1 Tax=Caenimonas sp. SL110 TaxID=1450524 RepID=UPI0009E42B1F|nr:AsmA family protein [Caenimonas sp. SL110]